MAAKTASTEIDLFDNAKSVVSDDALHDMTSWDSAVQALQDSGVTIESISDYGTGFAVVDKSRLVQVPFIIVEWRFNKSLMSDDGFVSAAVVTKNGDKWVINDGSTGIRQQLQAVTRRRLANKSASPQAGLMVPAGLTRSDYDVPDPAREGKTMPATTYYLSESPTPVL